VRTDERLSRSTVVSTLGALKAFFIWLADQPGYRKKIRYSDADYFNASEKDARIAKAVRQKAFPSLEQVHHVLSVMPRKTDIERRNRALIAFTLLTGARDGALASLMVKHVDLAAGRLDQDARDVRTKFAKTFSTWFLPVGGEAKEIVADWVNYLRKDLLFADNDPLFPATRVTTGEGGGFVASGLDRKNWSSAGPIRTIFKEAFEAAGLPYFNPHAFRNTLVQLGERTCKTPEEFKAWSQNLGHEHVLTTFTSYGAVASNRQAELIRGLHGESGATSAVDIGLLARLMRAMEAEQLSAPKG
ncbi:MAG: site-specific integrase, partial [Alphaproteobacteria bacterium]